jgi:hypothetical protein
MSSFYKTSIKSEINEENFLKVDNIIIMFILFSYIIRKLYNL